MGKCDALWETTFVDGETVRFPIYKCVTFVDVPYEHATP